MIEIKDLSISFDEKPILENINLKLPRTGLFCVCGESGSGKSSLLNAISGIIKFSGSIKFDRVEIADLNDQEMSNFRLKNIGFVFQDFKLFDNQTVEQNITFPLSVLSNCSEKNKKIKCNDLLDICGLNKFNKRICNTLSGGEKQRVAIARALINKPKLIIADEPTGSLDEKNGDEILKLLKKFSKVSLVLMVTHDIDLAKRYGDSIIFIKDKQISSIENAENNDLKTEPIISPKTHQKKKGTIPFGFTVSHSKQSMKNKRVRSALSMLFMSLGLMGIGLSVSFSNSISNDIKRSYSSLVKTSSISITKQYENIKKLEVVNYDDAKVIVDKFKDQLDINCGVCYKANFEEFFKDCNDFYLESGNKVCFLNELSIRNVNDFLAMSKISEQIFPYNISELEDDEIVLGLTINQIRTICATLNIERSVNSLSSYLENYDMQAIIDLANEEWEYSDQQIFTVKGFTLASDSYIAHSNPLFNKVVIEDNMRFPTTEERDIDEFPWVLDKITYIEASNKYEFIKLMRQNNLLEKYLFEVFKESYFVNKFFGKSPSEIDSLAIYYAPSYRFNEKEIDYILSVDDRLINPTIYNRYGYLTFPENLISGFANRTYFSLSEECLLETIENNSSVVFNKNETEVLNDDVLFSDYTESFKNPLKFIPLNNELKSGRPPIDLDEIVVSTGLLEKLNKDKYSDEFLYMATATKEINERYGIYNREYQTAKLKIVGVVENSELGIYHDNHWTEDFFILNNGQSALDLIPSSISFSIDNDRDIDDIVSKINRAFPQYEIVNPLLDINVSIDSLCNSISLFVLCISGVSLIISFILLCSCTYLHIQDIKKEIAMARCIGINARESLKFIYGFTFYSSLLALIIASLELTFTNVTISYFSSSILSLPFKFSINYLSYFAMAIGCVAIGFLTSLMTSKHIYKIAPIDCLKI